MASEPNHQRLAVSALTDFPLLVGAEARVELPHGLRLTAAGGRLPDSYLRAINAVAIEAGWYSQRTAQLIGAALEDSLLVRCRLSWRPRSNRGWSLGAGYSLTALGGGLSGLELLASGTDQPLPEGSDGGLTMGVESQLHLVDAQLSWETRIGERLIYRAAIGAAFTADSTTVIAPNWNASEFTLWLLEDLIAEGENYLDTIFQEHVHLPTFSMALGWSF